MSKYIVDNPAQRQPLGALYLKLQRRLELLAQTVQMRRSDGVEAALKLGASI